MGAAMLAASGAQALPTPVEVDWTLIRTDFVGDPQAAHYNPFDGLLYVAVLSSQSTGGGVYRIEADGSLTLIATAQRPRGVVVDYDTGAIFHSEGGSGTIFKTDFGATGRTTWVTGFGDPEPIPDDDPIGMAIAPNDYMGSVLMPGEAIVVDEGTNGPKDIWIWSPDAPEGETLLRADDGTLMKPVDVTIGTDGVWIVDQDLGAVFEILPGGVLSTVATLPSPVGITWDPLTGDLFVADAIDDVVYRVDPDTGVATVLASGFNFLEGFSDAVDVDVTPDGRFLFVTNRGDDAVHTFKLGTGFVPEPSGIALGLMAIFAFARGRRRAGSR